MQEWRRRSVRARYSLAVALFLVSTAVVAALSILVSRSFAAFEVLAIGAFVQAAWGVRCPNCGWRVHRAQYRKGYLLKPQRQCQMCGHPADLPHRRFRPTRTSSA